jgi:maltose/moltooligosaccharide transporter
MNNFKENVLNKFTTMQFLNFAMGFFGLQFAWQMRIILSGPVTESLGASPLIYGLIWLAGPFTGIIVQPIVGNLSDKTHTKFGRRRPYLLGGAVLASLALWIFPNSAGVANIIEKTVGHDLPVWTALLVAAIMIWVIDACINIAQGPYRALIPDTVPAEQYSLANSYISLAIGLGSVVAAGTAPILKWAINYQMPIEAQFIMGALAFSLAMLWTCLTIQEHKIKTQTEDETSENNDAASKVVENQSFFTALVEFFKLSPEVAKICLMQFFTWIGAMCMMIFFTQYSVHTIFGVPDLTTASASAKKLYESSTLLGTNFASISFAIFNLICFIVAIPIGILSSKYGNKKIHVISLISMAVAFFGMAFFTNTKVILALMALAGIGWASILALPFAMLSEFIKKGTEGSVMGIFNIFIAGPQVFVCTLVAWFISKCGFNTPCGINYHWEYTFIIGAVCLVIAALVTQNIKEKV